jgi:hypothetical protein
MESGVLIPVIHGRWEGGEPYSAVSIVEEILALTLQEGIPTGILDGTWLFLSEQKPAFRASRARRCAVHSSGHAKKGLATDKASRVGQEEPK